VHNVRIRRVVTTRAGGASRPPYDSFNLGDHVGDDPAAVATNRARLAGELGLTADRLAWMEQVHGRTATIVDGSADAPAEATDALITATPGVAVVVLVADCVPVLLGDADAGVVAAVHAGRVGARVGVVPAAVEAMRSLGARPQRIEALLGPAVCGQCYEVPDDMAADVEAHVPGSRCHSPARRPRGGPDRLRSPLHRRGRHPLQLPQAGHDGPDRRTHLAGAGPVSDTEERRRAGLALAARAVRERIDRACAAAGRNPDEVRLLAVTKTFPAEDAALLTDLGLTDLAENRDQEAAEKVREVARLRPGNRPRWHMVGRLQRNKARSVARWADEMQSLDSIRLADALAKAVGNALAEGERERPLDVLLQASIDDDTARGGCPLGDLDALAAAVARKSELRLRGLMAVAPLGTDPATAFARLAAAAQRLRRDHPDAVELSAGMSGDLEEAIAHGSTCVRVGTALLGDRGLASP
jgi:pyridoxal phosphate enzyme (YggS family)/YfiH family protein